MPLFRSKLIAPKYGAAGSRAVLEVRQADPDQRESLLLAQRQFDLPVSPEVRDDHPRGRRGPPAWSQTERVRLMGRKRRQLSPTSSAMCGSHRGGPGLSVWSYHANRSTSPCSSSRGIRWPYRFTVISMLECPSHLDTVKIGVPAGRRHRPSSYWEGRR